MKIVKPAFIWFSFIFIFVFGMKCSKDDALFELVSAEHSGILFENRLVEDEENNILKYEYFYNGGGVAIGDINNDGLEDIYFTGNTEPNALYLNQGDLVFADITKQAGVAGRKDGWATGVSMVDINSDGLMDIYVCYSGRGTSDKRENQLFVNQGNNKFKEQADEYGLNDPSFSIQASFFDFDKDGDLDMYLLNHNTAVIREVEFDRVKNVRDPFAGDKLYQNNNGTYVDISEKAGINGNPLGFGLGIAVSDINLDGWPDIYISNDYIEPDYLYINNKDGSFTDKMEHFLEHISHFSMGSDIADINNDGYPDIYTADMLPEDNVRQKLLYGPETYAYYEVMLKKEFYHQNMRNMLHINNSNGTFSEIGQLSGISNTDWSWASLFADFDNDGWKDLFVTNGYYRDYTDRDFLKYKNSYYLQKLTKREKADTFHLVKSMRSTPTHNYMFKNNGNLTFGDVSAQWGFETKGFSNGAAYADLDNDGDLDLVINNLNERAVIHKNLSNKKNPGKRSNYLEVKLTGKGKNTLGIGSKVYVYAKGRMQYFEQMPVRGFQSSVSSKIHVGLNDNKLVDSIIVAWPGGNSTIIRNVNSNQTVEINEHSAARNATLDPNFEKANTIFEETFTPIQFYYAKVPFNDFNRQPLMLTMLSTCGPIMETGDLNNDGLEDIFIGGTYAGWGKVFIQHDSMGFSNFPMTVKSSDRFCTDTDALFVDVDNDSDKDIYVARGGYNNYEENDSLLQDFIYLNDGAGGFYISDGRLPEMFVSTSCVVSEDYDKDGDVDLFVGGSVVPGAYPRPAPSFLLENNGKGEFRDVTKKRMPDIFENSGMVTDAAWVDVDNDGWMDLVVVGEFMPISIYSNVNGKELVNSTNRFFKKPLTGKWSTLSVADFDEDGDEDLLVGNFGLNSQMRASADKPIQMVYGDFDENGSIDPIMQYYIGDELYPFASRDEILTQMKGLKVKFSDYHSYAKAKINDIVDESVLKTADRLYVNTLETTYLENQRGKLTPGELPLEIQFAPVYDISVLDYNNDGHFDFIAAGNQGAIRLRMGKIDANFGQLFEGDGKGNFKYIPQKISGLKLRGDVKSLKTIRIGNNEFLLAGINNVGISTYKLRRGK